MRWCGLFYFTEKLVFLTLTAKVGDIISLNILPFISMGENRENESDEQMTVGSPTKNIGLPQSSSRWSFCCQDRVSLQCCCAWVIGYSHWKRWNEKCRIINHQRLVCLPASILNNSLLWIRRIKGTIKATLLLLLEEYTGHYIRNNLLNHFFVVPKLGTCLILFKCTLNCVLDILK